jgi:putative endonuclease
MKIFTYVYILQSEGYPDRFYIGRTADLRTRIALHNAGRVHHTTKWKPWRIKSYVAHSEAQRAIALEQYLKSASGRAFAKKRL